MNPTLVLLVAALTVGTSEAQTPQRQASAASGTSSVESPECATVVCRPAKKYRVKRKDGTFAEREVSRPMPIVLSSGVVFVLPEEEIYLAFDTGPESQLIPRAVESADFPGGTLTFQLTHDPATGDSLLKVTNRTKYLLKYSLGIQLPEEEQSRETSSCPAPPGMVGYEHWPHGTMHILVRRFRALEQNADVRCE